MIVERIDLPGAAAGTLHRLTVHRFGRPGARPRVHVQAGLHADEVPGMLCAVALRRRLTALEAAGAVTGEIALIPLANPIGAAQEALGAPIGRFDLADGVNFNRGFPELGPGLIAAVAAELDADPAANVARVRAALARLLADLPAAAPAAQLKAALLGLAQSADLVLDLHCDGEAALHLYTHTDSADTFAPLAARLGCAAVLLAERSGGDPFDEAVSRPWRELAAAAPDRPVPFAGQSAAIELRGRADVDAALAEADATAILDFLVDRGALSGPAPPPPPTGCAPTPLAGCMPLIAPAGGILVHRGPVGRDVRAGEVLAEIVDPETGAATPVLSPCDGMFFARAVHRLARAGKRLGKVAGRAPIRSGDLLSP